MEQTHVPTSSQPIAACEALATPLRTLRRLSEPRARLWLEGAFSDKRTETISMVLLTNLPAIFLSSIERRRTDG
jgi:hypothetical protein